MSAKKSRRPAANTSWDPVADWYAGWAGGDGSEHHRRLAIPATLDMLEPSAGEYILDIGAGPAALARHIARAGAHYTGVDASPRLLAVARRLHGRHGRFLQADAARLDLASGITADAFDGAVFLLSLQDMEPLDAVLHGAAWALRPGGRLVILMTHPCFRVPRQSGWGWDDGRRLQYRRVDRYLSPLAVPMKRYGTDRQAVTRSFHRPLEVYVNTLAAAGLLIDCVRELPTYRIPPSGPRARAENLANEEIPLFLGLRARKA